MSTSMPPAVHPWIRAVRFALLLDACVLGLTGIMLMTVYVPSTLSAWASVRFINVALEGGWAVRGLHHFASHAFLVLSLVELAEQIRSRSMLQRVGKLSLPVGWWLTLAGFAIVLLLAITGHGLPWDQAGYWARRVELNILGMTPVLGGWLQNLAQGGPELGQLALTRFYALHVVVLPLALWLVVRRWIGLAHAGPADRPSTKYPLGYAEVVFGAALTVLLFYFAWRHHGAPLDAPADPESDYPARPEWFLLPLYQLRHYFHGAFEFFGVAGVPGILALYLVTLPLLDRSDRSPRWLWEYWRIPAAVAGAAIVALGLRAVRNDRHDVEFQRSKAHAEVRAQIASDIARDGVPPDGPLAMMRRDPELRGEALFEQHCAGCHVLEGHGDPKQTSAPALDGWGTEPWIFAMLHAPDTDDHFGRTPFREMMPSMDEPPPDSSSKRLSPEEMQSVSLFLVAEGDEEAHPAHDEDRRKHGESVLKSRCTTCHLYKGEGDDVGQDYAPELSGYGSLRWVRAQIANPATTTTYRSKAVNADLKGHMPAFQSELSPLDIDILAQWMRSHARRGTVHGVPSSR